MKNKTLLKAVLVTTLLGISALSFGDDYLKELKGVPECAPEALSKTGASNAFNAVQCKRAMAAIRTDQPQVGNTCVCESYLNTAFDLGVSGTMADLGGIGVNCNNAMFGDIYRIGKSGSQLEGKVGGGLYGVLVEHEFLSTSEAMEKIIEAVSDGRVVAVGLSARPIYEYLLADRLKGLTVSNLGVTASHAVVVRAVLRDARGKPSSFVLLDSSGPGRRYSVPVSVFEEAFSTWITLLSRGMFISTAKSRF